VLEDRRMTYTKQEYDIVLCVHSQVARGLWGMDIGAGGGFITRKCLAKNGRGPQESGAGRAEPATHQKKT